MADDETSGGTSGGTAMSGVSEAETAKGWAGELARG